VNAAAGTTARPGIVSLITVWLWAIGFYNLLVGALVLISRDNEQTIAYLGGVEPGVVLFAGISEVVLGLGIIWTAVSLRRGARGARGLIAFFMVARIVLTGLAVAAGWGGTNVLVAGVIHVLVPFVVLWALYGNDRADAWFNES
jgi:hypothetical protein